MIFEKCQKEVGTGLDKQREILKWLKKQCEMDSMSGRALLHSKLPKKLLKLWDGDIPSLSCLPRKYQFQKMS